jgi:hypothetical protein
MVQTKAFTVHAEVVSSITVTDAATDRSLVSFLLKRHMTRTQTKPLQVSMERLFKIARSMSARQACRKTGAFPAATEATAHAAAVFIEEEDGNKVARDKCHKE